MDILRPSKDATIKAALSLTPGYTKLFRELQKGGGRVIFPPEIAVRQNVFGPYVTLYDNESKIGAALFLALLGEDGLKVMNAELKDASQEDQQKFLDEMAKQEDWDEISSAFQIPNSPQEWEAARKQLELLPVEERKEAEKRGGFFWTYFFGSFFNILSLMVHGEKLTALVPRAINGDENAFMKAVQTDRMLLLHHPYFRDRKLQAQDEGDKRFLMRLANRESIPIVNGPVQFPGLYMLFGILESYRWLNDMSASEILDVCVNAGLDLYQNRIDDADYVSKRLREYRHWQKALRMSRI